MSKVLKHANHVAGMVLFFLAVIAIVVGVVWFQAYNEAASYRRVTGHHVTTWDAVWLDLRVQETVLPRLHPDWTPDPEDSSVSVLETTP